MTEASAVTGGALTDEDIIPEVRSAEPVSASDREEEDGASLVGLSACRSDDLVDCRQSLRSFEAVHWEPFRYTTLVR